MLVISSPGDTLMIPDSVLPVGGSEHQPMFSPFPQDFSQCLSYTFPHHPAKEQRGQPGIVGLECGCLLSPR